MPRSQMTLAIALCLLAGVQAAAADAAPAAPPPIELGRRFEAIPWLTQEKDVPNQSVPYTSIPLLANLPQRTAYYEIAPDVAISGYNYFFYVRSYAGTYLVGSVYNLVKLCRELEVLAEIRDKNLGGQFVDSVGESVVGIGTGIGNLIVHPGQSLASFGRRIRVTGRTVERAVGTDPKVGTDERGVDRSDLGMGPAGAQRRKLAAELGIDVYTDNPVLRKALTELSQVRAAGSFATMAIPFHLGVFANFNPFTGDEAMEALIRDYDPYEVRRQIGQNLEREFGQSREGGQSDLSRLLLNPNYTPREIAYIGKDFADMAGVAGLDLVLRVLAAAESPERADFLAMELRLYNFYHHRISPIQSFHAYLNMFAAVDQSGYFQFLFAGDTIRPWHVTDDAFNMMLQDAINLKARGMTIWVLGDVDPTLIEKARAKGVSIRQNIILDPQFFPEGQQAQPR